MTPSAVVPISAPAELAAGAVGAASLSHEHLAIIAHARQRGHKVHRAAGVATFSGWTTAVLAFATCLGGIFSLDALLLGGGMAVVAWIELRNAAALRRLDMAAPRRLAINQIALSFLLCTYSAWCIAQAILGPGPYDTYLAANDQLSQTIEPIARLHKTITVGFYSAVIAGSVMVQGLAAVYYLTRRRCMADYVATTPAWALRVLCAAAG